MSDKKNKIILLKNVTNTIKTLGYTYMKFYSKDYNIKYIQLQTNLQRKFFLLHVPDFYIIKNTTPDYTINDSGRGCVALNTAAI